MPDAAGVTALHLAVSAASMPLVSILVDAGGDPLAKDSRGISPAGQSVSDHTGCSADVWGGKCGAAIITRDLNLDLDLDLVWILRKLLSVTTECLIRNKILSIERFIML